MSICTWRSFAATLAAGALQAGAIAQIPVSSAFNVAVEADAHQLLGGFAIDSFTATQLGTLNPYFASLSVTNTEPGFGFVTTTSTASATWTNAGAGTVTFRDMGWTRNSLGMHEAKLNNFLVGADVWSYTFQATSDGFLTLNYNVSHVGFGFGLLGIMIHWDGAGGGIDLENANNPDVSGSFVRPVLNGSTYTIGIYNAGNIFAAAGQPLSTGHLNADFSWNIGLVPEPASLAAMAAGLAGLAIRRRRRP